MQGYCSLVHFYAYTLITYNSDSEEEGAGEKKIMLDSFTKQTNALDVDKHM